MKTLLVLVLFWAALGLVQCQKNDVTPVIDGTVKLRASQSATFKTAGKSVLLRVAKLSDSRCPTNMQCIWQGQALAEVELRGATGDAQLTSLCLGACQNDSAAVVIEAVPYWLVLASVDPYPSAATASKPSTATLRLTPR